MIVICVAGRRYGRTRSLVKPDEQGRLSWNDLEEKRKFCRALAWHTSSSASSATVSMLALATKRYNNTGRAYNAPAKPGTKACKQFNDGMCTTRSSHLDVKHICSHCLTSINQASPHSEKSWTRNRNTVAKHA